MTRRFFPALLLASAPFLCAQVPPESATGSAPTSALPALPGLPSLPALPEITALQTEVTETETIFTGNARLAVNNALLTADTIRYNLQTKVARATGQVTLTRGDQRLLADELTYDLVNGTYTVGDFRLGQFPFYASGRSASGAISSTGQTVVDYARLSHTEPDLLAPSMTAERITYAPGQYVRAEKARLGVGPVTPIKVPLLERQTKNALLSEVSATAGISSQLGTYVDLGLLLPVTPSLRTGGELALYSNRGILFGPALTYRVDEPDNRVRGSLRSGYIHDAGGVQDLGRDVNGSPVRPDRGYLAWDHQQFIGEDLTLLGQVNYWSDSEITRDFRRELFRGEETPDNFLESTYVRDNYVLSAFLRFQPNSYTIVQQRLPEIRFDGLPLTLGSGIAHRLAASIVVLEDTDADQPLVGIAGSTTQTTRFDTYYALTRRITPREWLSVQPILGGRLTHYTSANGSKDSYTRALAEVGFDAEAHAYGQVSNYKNARWQIDGLRHAVTPRVSYRYIPEADRGRAYIPRIDRDAFSTELQPLGLGNRRNLDTLGRTNTFRVGVDNALQTRDPAYGSRNLVEANFAADWRLDRETGRDALSAIQTALIFTPVRWLSYDVYQSYTPDSGRIQEMNTGLTLRDAKVWSLRLGTQYLSKNPGDVTTRTPLGGLREYTADLRYTLNESFEALMRVTYDGRGSRFPAQSFGLRQTLRNRWFIDYVLTFTDGSARESDVGFGVKVEIIGF